MTARCAMRILAAAVVVLALASFTAAVVNNTNNYRLTLTVRGAASDFLQVSKRNSFCAAFTTILQTSPLASDVQSCVIDSAVNSATAGEVVVTAFFSFTAARTDASTVASTINTAYTSGRGSTEFGAPSTGSVAAAAVAGTFPSYFAQVETVVSPVLSDANLLAFTNAITASQPGITSVSCPIKTTISSTAGTPTEVGSRLICNLGSITLTRAELVTGFRAAVTTGTGLATNGGGGPYLAAFVRDTGLLGPASGTAYTISATVFVTGASASSLQTGTEALRNALVTALTPVAVTANVNLASQQTVTGGATVAVSIAVADEARANRVLEILKVLIGQTLGTSPTTFIIGGITSLTITPGLQSSAAATVFPGLVFRYTIPIVNTSSAFTSSPSQLRRVCEAITAPTNGNVTTCAIAEINRLTGSNGLTSANGDSGSLVLELTAANNSASLSATQNAVRNVANVTGGFFLGTPVEASPFPGTATTQTLSITLGAPYSSADSVTQTVRDALCSLITTNPFVPQTGIISNAPATAQNAISCSIRPDDITTSGSTATVLARVTYRIPDFSIDNLATALVRARTAGALPRTPQDFNTVITAIAAANPVPTPFTFVTELEFNVNIAFADFNNANQVSFANAVRAAAGNDAIVSFVSSAAASNLTPSNGTQVIVRVFTTSAVAQGDAYEAIAAQVAGTNLTFNATSAVFNLQSPAGFRRATFSPAVSANEFPVPPTPPATPAPATPAPAPVATPAAAPALTPQIPIVVPTDLGDQNSVSRNIQFELTGTGDLAVANLFVQQLVAAINAATPGAIISASVVGGVTTVGKKFVTQNFRFVANFVANTPANAAQINTRIANAVNSNAISAGRVVSFSTSTSTITPVVPAVPGVPAAPAVAPSTGAFTNGNIDVTILGTRSSLSTADQNALQSAVAAAINGTAVIVGTTDTSTSRKFTMQANAVRVTMAVSAPAAQYPTVESIATRVLTVSRANGNRLGNSNVVNVAASNTGAAARSGPVALTVLVALLVAMLSAMAQF